MNPTLRQMRALVALAKSGNFTLAAQSLHVTQSALSGLIKELEQTLGARVADRKHSHSPLTDIGRELYPLFSQILDDLDSALTNIADQTRLKKGVVRIAAPQLMSCTVMPHAIAAYRAGHPEIQARLVDCAVESVSARVLSGDSARCRRQQRISLHSCCGWSRKARSARPRRARCQPTLSARAKISWSFSQEIKACPTTPSQSISAWTGLTATTASGCSATAR
jgi:DNA-binding transcriptional LysR family regulator